MNSEKMMGMSAPYAFEEDRKKALAAGMNGHLAKPIEIATMMEMLAENLIRS